jgi:hypothetical protein
MKGCLYVITVIVCWYGLISLTLYAMNNMPDYHEWVLVSFGLSWWAIPSGVDHLFTLTNILWRRES